jgi:tetratricopeptide (TPR) repeat protein
MSAEFPRERLSLCMIVRDEERCLARCLASAAPWVGEIVVVDTGSTDRSVEIAESFGARVVHFPWINDFSAARNVALDAAINEWALVLDADEEIVVDDEAEFAAALNQTVLDGFSFPIQSEIDSGEMTNCLIFRLFRRTKEGMRYRGQLHEQIMAVSAGKVETAALRCLHFKHDGYTSKVSQARGKGERNLRLARALVADQPDDAFAWHCLGLSLGTGQEEEKIQAYEKCLTMLKDAGRDGANGIFEVINYLALAVEYVNAGQLAKGRTVFDRAIELFPDAPDLRYERARMRLFHNDYAGAAEDLAVCLTDKARKFCYISFPGAIGYAAKTQLASAYLHLGRSDEAEALLAQAVAEAPVAFPLPRQLLANLLLQRGLWGDARPLLSAALEVEPEAQETRFKLGWCLFKLERYEEAETTLLPLRDLPDTQHLLGKVYLDWGHGAKALDFLTECPQPAAGLARGWAYYLQNDPGRAAACWEEWLRAGAADWGTKDTLNTFLFLMQGGGKSKGQPERPAEPLRDMNLWFRLLLRYKCFNDIEQVISRGPQLGDRMWLPLRKKWAITLASEGFTDLALQLLLDARSVEPEDAEIYYWLGYCSMYRRNVEEAKVLWQTCLRYQPDHALAGQSLSLLG